jgi:hypothetical protein
MYVLTGWLGAFIRHQDWKNENRLLFSNRLVIAGTAFEPNKQNGKSL